MHLTTSHFILVILLLYNIECLAKPIGENDQDDADQTDTPDDEHSGQTDTDVKEALNTKWADVETNRAFEFGTIARQCKQALVQAKVTIQSIMRDALEKLHSKACRTAPDTRRIVNEAMEPWGTQLSTLVNAVRGDMVKISNVYIAYFKLAVARSEIYAPRGAEKLNDLFDKTIAEGLLDINGEKRDPNAVILNNAVRFLSGDLNPAQEMYEELQKLTIDNGDAFEENLEEAINQIETVGKILLDMVDTVEDTTYRGLKLYLDGMRVLRLLRTIYAQDEFRGKRESVGDIEELNEKVRLGIRMSKNIKALDHMYAKKHAAAPPNQ